MRRVLLLLLVACAAGPAQAQFSLGPNGVSHPPINLVTIYRLLTNLWSTMTGSAERGKEGVEKREEMEVDYVQTDPHYTAEERAAGDTDYDTHLDSLKSRIQAASEAAALAADTPVGDPSLPPSTRAILIPKKKVTLSKWPIVYGVLNGLLLAAAIILAKPYFVDGETVVSKYGKEKELEKYEEEKIKGYYDYKMKDMEHDYKMKGMYGHKNKGKGGGYSQEAPHPPAMYPPKTIHMPPIRTMPTYPMPPVPPPAAKFHYGSPALMKPVAAPILPPIVPPIVPPLVPTIVPHLSAVSYHKPLVINVDDEEHYSSGSHEGHRISSHEGVRSNSHEGLRSSSHEGLRSSEVFKSDERLKGDTGDTSLEDVPFNELHYYNPTIFTSDQSSSYACIQKMICLNPSRSARDLAIDTAIRSSAESGGKDSVNWQRMIRRLDDAAAHGNLQGGCEKYYCPPQIPTEVDPVTGDHYAPPPRRSSISEYYDYDRSSEPLSPFSDRVSEVSSSYSSEYSSTEPEVEDEAAPAVSPLDAILEKQNKFVPSIITAQPYDEPEFLKGAQLQESVEYFTDAPEMQGLVQIERVQAPKINTVQYPKVNLQNTKSKEAKTDDEQSESSSRGL